MRLHVEDWMTRSPVTATPDMSVLQARRLLHRYVIRHLPVVNGNQLVGMVSDRDVSIGDPWVAASLAGLQSSLLSGRYRSVATVMSSPVRVVRLGESIAFAADEMRRWRVSALPVVDGGSLVGIITATDCLAALAAALLDRPEEVSGSDPPDVDPDAGKTTPMPQRDRLPERPSCHAGSHPAVVTALEPKRSPGIAGGTC